MRINSYPIAQKQHREFQLAGWSSTGELLHCGPINARRMSSKVAIRAHRRWLAWRRLYLESHPGNYPLRTSSIPRYITATPIGCEGQHYTFTT